MTPTSEQWPDIPGAEIIRRCSCGVHVHVEGTVPDPTCPFHGEGNALYPCCEHCEPYPRHVYGDAGEPNWCELAGQKDAHRTPCRGTWSCRL